VPFLSAGDGVLGGLGSSTRPPKTGPSDGGFDAGKTTAVVRANDVAVVASPTASTAAASSSVVGSCSSSAVTGRTGSCCSSVMSPSIASSSITGSVSLPSTVTSTASSVSADIGGRSSSAIRVTVSACTIGDSSELQRRPMRRARSRSSVHDRFESFEELIVEPVVEIVPG
ncbi:unnamed protein product, partial [Linum tenue]